MRFRARRVTLVLLGVVCFASVFYRLIEEQQARSVGDEFRQVDDSEEQEPVVDSLRFQDDKHRRAAVAAMGVETIHLTTTNGHTVNDTLKRWLPDSSNTLGNYFTMRENITVDDPRYRNGVLVYAHLNKAAGSTTKTCLSSVSAKTRRNLAPVLDSSGRGRIQILLSEGSKGYNTLMGGYAFGICEAVKNRDCSYFTILRDPYERLISSYTYCRRASMDQTCQALGPWDASLKEWAVHQGSYFFRQLLLKPWFCTISWRSNPQYNNLSDIPHSSRTSFAAAPCWFKEKVILKRSLTHAELDEILQYCLDNLENWFSVIGLTDEYDLSIAMLERVYQLPFEQACTGRKINVSDYKNLSEDKIAVNRSSLPDMVSQWKTDLQEDSEVSEALRADILLYEKALDIFSRQKKIFLENIRT